MAQQVVSSLLPVPVSFPYSPLLRKVQADIAQAEIILGRLQCDQEKWSTCQHDFEKAFQRLFGTVDMVIIHPEDLESYAEACSKQRTELCRSWIQRLGHFYPHSTIEFQAIAKSFPRFNDDFVHPHFTEKTPKPIKRPTLTRLHSTKRWTFISRKNAPMRSRHFENSAMNFPLSLSLSRTLLASSIFDSG